MVGHHLPVVLPPGLGVEHKHLVNVACGLKEIVELDGAGERGVGIASPDVDWVENGCREASINILQSIGRAYAPSWLANAFRLPFGSQISAKDEGGRRVRRTTPKPQLKV